MTRTVVLTLELTDEEYVAFSKECLINSQHGVVLNDVPLSSLYGEINKQLKQYATGATQCHCCGRALNENNRSKIESLCSKCFATVAIMTDDVR